mgnify:CR=1 FL=1
MKKIKEYITNVSAKVKRAAIMCIIAVLGVFGCALSAFASEPTIADNIITSFGTAGEDLKAVVYGVGGLAMGVCVVVVGFRLAVSLFKRLAK